MFPTSLLGAIDGEGSVNALMVVEEEDEDIAGPPHFPIGDFLLLLLPLA
jgi:hypothetical protein